jgi:uncharacterized protein (DUF433 family)
MVYHIGVAINCTAPCRCTKLIGTFKACSEAEVPMSWTYRGKQMISTVEHVQEREGEYYVTSTRVPIGVVIAAWKRGTSPEHITEQFPILSLADIYGVITYYLDHEQELEAHFARFTQEYEQARLASRAEHPEFYDDLHQRIEEWRTEHPRPSAEPSE